MYAGGSHWPIGRGQGVVYISMASIWGLLLVGMLISRWMNPDVENIWTDWRAIGLVGFLVLFNLLRAVFWNQGRRRRD